MCVWCVCGLCVSCVCEWCMGVFGVCGVYVCLCGVSDCVLSSVVFVWCVCVSGCG